MGILPSHGTRCRRLCIRAMSQVWIRFAEMPRVFRHLEPVQARPSRRGWSERGRRRVGARSKADRQSDPQALHPSACLDGTTSSHASVHQRTPSSTTFSNCEQRKPRQNSARYPVNAGSYFHTFLQPRNAATQKRFFDRYLKGIDNDWENEPPVEVEIRGPGDTVKRVARSTAWPLPETQWTRFFLDAANKTLSPHQSQETASASYPALSEGLTFSTEPWERDIEIVGPVKARLFVSSSTRDMDIFAT